MGGLTSLTIGSARNVLHVSVGMVMQSLAFEVHLSLGVFWRKVKRSGLIEGCAQHESKHASKTSAERHLP